MKKLICAALALLLLLNASAAVASDLGVTLISKPTPTPEPLTLSDMQLEALYKIPGYADVTLLSFEFVDMFPQYAKDAAGNHETYNKYNSAGDGTHVLQTSSGSYQYYYSNICWQQGGTDADFAFLLVDITNKQKTPVLYSEEIIVKAVYDNEFEYMGWVRQFDYNYDTNRSTDGTDPADVGPKKYGTFIRATLNPENEKTIDQVYTGHYVIGCTLPNVVVNGTEPLRLEIQLGENTLIYYIRK